MPLGTSTSASTTTASLVSPALLEILGHLKLAVAQLRLYPKDSPQVVKVGTAAYQAFVTHLEHHPMLVLAQTPRGLLVDGQKLAAKDFATITLEASIVSLLLDAGIKTIAFRKGLLIDELLTFIHALTQKFWDVKEGKEINRRLREERVIRISVDEIEYVAVGEGDLLIKDAAQKLEGSNSAVGDLLRSLEKLTEAVIDPQVSADARLQIIKKLIEQDPSLLQKAQNEAYAALGDQKPGFVTLRETREMIGEIVRSLPAAPQGLKEILRRMGHLLADAFRHDPQESALLRSFLTGRASQLLPQLEAERLASTGPVARAQMLLEADVDGSTELLLKEAESLVRELTALKRSDLAAKILARLTGLLADRTVVRRLAAAEALLTMIPTMERGPLALVRDGFESLVRNALDKESEGHAYGKLTDLATFLTEARLRQGEFEGALETLSVLRKHHVVKDTNFPHRPEHAYRALERIAGGSGFPPVADKLRSGDPLAIRVVETLDEAVTRFLIAEIKKVEGTPQRMRLAEIIARIGPGAGAVLAEEIQKMTAPSDTLRLLEVLPTAVPESVAIVALTSLIRHPAIAVRRRTAGILADRAYARSGDVLLGALTDEKDSAVRAAILEALGRLRHLDAKDDLLKIADARQESDEVRAAACAALGRIGHIDAIPLLASLTARSPRGITGILRPTPSLVRVAAVRALSVFRAYSAARDALKRATEDSDTILQSAARELLYAPIGEALAEAQQAAAAQEAKTGGSKLGGSLSEVPIDQVCQLIASGEKTGLLMITFDGPVARVWFENGMVTAADFGDRRDQEAFNSFIRLKKGQFVFQPGEIAPKRRVRIPVAMVLLEACRVADEGEKA